MNNNENLSNLIARVLLMAKYETLEEKLKFTVMSRHIKLECLHENLRRSMEIK